MLVQIITENGQKKVIPLTADAGAGLPVGFIAPAYKKGNYSGWLYLDGRDTTGTSEELSTHYPILYAFLGSNKLPDYREFALVGAEQNTTDTIATHDVYTEGQFKDDQLQNHGHSITDPGHKHTTALQYGTPKSGAQGTTYIPAGQPWKGWETNTVTTGITVGNPNSGRHGDVTRGKRKAVYFYIKATSGLSENAQDNVVAQLNEERSYSTEEVNTGTKWIDGKPIYRRVFTGTASNTNQAENIATISNVSSVVSVRNLQKASNAGWYENWGYARTTNEELESSAYFDIATGKLYQSHKSSIFNSQPYTITLEYTKTTD